MTKQKKLKCPKCSAKLLMDCIDSLALRLDSLSPRYDAYCRQCNFAFPWYRRKDSFDDNITQKELSQYAFAETERRLNIERADHLEYTYWIITIKENAHD